MERGFIATSLLYSFFLAFIAVVAVLLNNFVANKTILDRFNGKVQEELNSSTYTISVYTKNANMRNGMTLTNLISNGNFRHGQEFWTTFGDASYSTSLWMDNFAILKSNDDVSGSYIFQNVYLMKDSTYYFAVDYLHNVDTPLNIYIGESGKGIIQTKNNLSKMWSHASQRYRSIFDGNVPFVLGDSGSTNYTGNTYFSNVMLLNLTASFGEGYEPDVLWLDKNIGWFDGTVSYINAEGIESGESYEVFLTPYKDYDEYTIQCMNESGSIFENYEIVDVAETENLDDARSNKILRFHDIKSNVKCEVEWRIAI